MNGWSDAKIRVIRDLMMFGLGLAGGTYEIFFVHGQRDTGVMVLIAGLLGLPAFLKASSNEKKANDE